MNLYCLIYNREKKRKVLQFYLVNTDFPIKNIYTLVIEGKPEERGNIFHPIILAALIKPDQFLGLWIPSHQD